ncbi:DUF6951 family protein [Candidatus Methanomassiliicoccus intestinalis]|uniref:DUF6951 family protein n=1 Tax=Candidatus Methanomassiliicoccus intestinalis TaxID=1406512 RepID=UPI0037DC53DE
MATVVAHMRICDKTHTITATKRSDGDLEIKIASDCPKVAAYGENLGTLSLLDITDYEHSKINAAEMRKDISPTCISPIAIFNAAWLEMGMISQSLAQKVKENSIEFKSED